MENKITKIVFENINNSHNFDLKGELMIHPGENMGDLITQLDNAGILEMWSLNVWMGRPRCIVMRSSSCYPKNVNTFYSLLKILESNKVEMNWKSDDLIGYRIDGEGNVMEQWELDDGAC